MSDCFYYVLVVSPIAQTGRLLDFLVGLLTGSLGTVPEPDATLAHFSRRNFLRTLSGFGFTRLTRLTFALGAFGFFPTFKLF